MAEINWGGGKPPTGPMGITCVMMAKPGTG